MKFQCDKDVGMALPIAHTFEESVTINPYKLNYSIGDTLFLNLTIPGKKLLDTKTNTRILFDSVSFTSIAQVDLLYNNPFVANGPLVKFVFPLGISANTGTGGPQSYAHITYGCVPSADYTLSLGMVLIEKGVFGVSFFNTAINQCFNNFFKNSSLRFTFNVSDTHKQ